jgi:hypothetical protein
MIELNEYKETVLWLRRNKDKVKDFTPYIDTLGNDIVQSVLKGEKVSLSRPRKGSPHKTEWKAYQKRARQMTYENLKDVCTDKPMARQRDQLRSKEFYTFDHKISIRAGFKHGIPLEVISCMDNLRLIDCYTNTKKGIKCFVDESNKWIADKYNVEYIT